MALYAWKYLAAFIFQKGALAMRYLGVLGIKYFENHCHRNLGLSFSWLHLATTQNTSYKIATPWITPLLVVKYIQWRVTGNYSRIFGNVLRISCMPCSTMFNPHHHHVSPSPTPQLWRHSTFSPFDPVFRLEYILFTKFHMVQNSTQTRLHLNNLLLEAE